MEYSWFLEIDVRIRIGEPVALETYRDRKELARATEQLVRDGVVGLLRGE